MMAEKTIHICHLYYDILNLYGDNGNIRTLEKRLSMRGIDTKVSRVTFGPVPEDNDYDIIFIGGGQDFEQEILVKDLFEYKADWLKAEIEKGTVILAICGGYQMLGKYYEAADGTKVDFLGGINVYTTANDKRMIGNFIYEYTTEDGETFPIVGFENHNGQTWLGEGVRPMGTIVKGFGNNGEDKTEGAAIRMCLQLIHTARFFLKMQELQMSFFPLHISVSMMRNYHRLSMRWRTLRLSI